MQFGCDKISSNFEFNQQKCNCNVDVDVDVDVVVKQAQVQIINYFFSHAVCWFLGCTCVYCRTQIHEI